MTTDVGTVEPGAPAKPDDGKAAESPPVDSVPSGQAAPPSQAAKPEEKPVAKEETAPPAPLEIKPPEGVDAADEVFGKLTPLAKELGLDSAKGQKLAEFYAGVRKDAQARQEKFLSETISTWNKAIEADKELGGSHLEQSRAMAKRAVARYGSESFAEFLSQSGLGSHPEMVRMLARIGKATSEDTVSGTAGTKAATAADPQEAFLRALYPTMFQNK